jgi:hypothetical protein
MWNMLRALFGKNPSKTSCCPVSRPRLSLEHLETRLVPTVTFHGGALLSHVEVQGLYLGSDWWPGSSYYGQTGQLEGFLNNIVHSSYMDMLTHDNYFISRGSFDPGDVFGVNINKSAYLSDGAIRQYLQSDISGGYLKTPDANRLYMVFVEDNVVVGDSKSNSQNAFTGYHGAFRGVDALGHGADIHYAVIAYPGGTAGNAGRWWLNALDTMTLTASHELAEAVTDPNVNYKTLGWYDDQLGEVGDITNTQTVYLNGYAVQRIADWNDQAMTPVGATGVNPVNFILGKDGTLYMISNAGVANLGPNIASLSDQGIDYLGHAMVDIITTGGLAYEFHEGIGWTYLTSGVKMAKAGQGVSYLLLTNGQVWEYKDSGSWSYVTNGVTAIDAGTDRFGVNMVTEISYSEAYEFSDSTGKHDIGSNVASISAGQQGVIGMVLNDGTAWLYFEMFGGRAYEGAGVAQMAVGTDQNGNYTYDLLYTNGDLWDSRLYTWLASGVGSVGKARNGVLDVVFAWGPAYLYGSFGWSYLGSNVQTAA